MSNLLPAECIAKRQELLEEFTQALQHLDSKLASADRMIDVGRATSRLEKNTESWGFDTSLKTIQTADGPVSESAAEGLPNSFKISLQCKHSECIPGYAVSFEFEATTTTRNLF